MVDSRNVFWSESQMDSAGVYPSILAIGDSWFWYPFPGGSLVNSLGPIVARQEHKIYAIGNNGLTVKAYVDGTHEHRINGALKRHGDSLSAVLISGGGNDYAGFNNLRPLLRTDCISAKNAEDCFTRSPSNQLQYLIGEIEKNYIILIDRVLARCTSDRFKGVFVHNYDYAIPTGKSITRTDGAWLKQALDDARVPQNLHIACMRYVLDQFTAVLERIVVKYRGRVIFVKSAGTLGPDDWANELHPTPDGFKKIASRHWQPRFLEHGLA